MKNSCLFLMCIITHSQIYCVNYFAESIKNGNIKHTKEWLNIIINPNKVIENNKTALELAVLYNKKEITTLLLKSGANPNQLSADGKSRVLFRTKSVQMLKILLDFGADPMLATHNGKTALDFFKEKNLSEFATLLK